MALTMLLNQGKFSIQHTRFGLEHIIFLICALIFLPQQVISAAQPTRQFDRDISNTAQRNYIHQISTRSKQMQNRYPDSAIKLLQTGLNLSRELRYKYGQALMISGFADMNEKFGNYIVAFKNQKEAYNLFTALKRKKEATAAQLNIGRLLGKRHLLKESNTLLEHVLAAYLKCKHEAGQLQTLITMGDINALNQNYKEALKNDQQAALLLDKMPVDTIKLSVIAHMAQLYQKLDNHKAALEYYEKGISISDSKQFAGWHILLLRSAAELRDQLGDTARAATMHQQSLLKAKEFSVPEQEARSQMSYAWFIKDSKVENGIDHLKSALEISQSINNSRLTSEIFRSLADFYQQQSNYQQAIAALRQHQYLLDSVQKKEAGHRLALLEGSYELAENKIHIQTLQLTARRRSEQRNLGYIVLIGVSVLLGFISFYYYQSKKMNQRLSQSNQIKDKLFSIIGHDLRNPIGGMVQLLDLVEQDAENADDVRHMVGLMKLQGTNALEILGSLLKWGETQLSGIKAEVTSFDPQYLVQRNIELLKKQITDKELHINTQLANSVNLLGDANHFDFIIRNLLSNAIKFSFAGAAIDITVSKIKGNRLQFEVKDYGKGVSIEQQEQYANANMNVSFGTQGEKGTGLGLLLAKEFARANGSDLSLASTERKGASFSFSFKIA